MWGDLVEVVSCDMRLWEAPEKADILVSELLGSFGDNELSPECLDGAQRFLKGKYIYLTSSTINLCTDSIIVKPWKIVNMMIWSLLHFKCSRIILTELYFSF